MKHLARCVFLLAAVAAIGERAQADGKFYGRETIPADIPYQRAFIIFHEGWETLVLQSKYELPESADANSLGWVVPVPAVPEIASADAEAATMFFSFASLRTGPKVFSILDYIFLIVALFFLGGVVFLLLCLVEYPFLSKIGLSKAVWKRRLRTSLIVTIVAFFLTMATSLRFESASGVEVIKAKKAGIYDVKVIRGANAEAILSWLKENGFAFGDSDVQVFEDYVNRKWCFAVAKAQPDPKTEEHKIVSEGMVAPLILKFETDRAIYPLALTSTVGTSTEVLLYTLSQKKLSCRERLVLRRARSTKPANLIGHLLEKADPKTKALFENVPESMTLCKFKKKLSPDEMKKDLEFEFAADNDPYVEKRIVW
jgi:hypothetical protein